MLSVGGGGEWFEPNIGPRKARDFCGWSFKWSQDSDYTVLFPMNIEGGCRLDLPGAKNYSPNVVMISIQRLLLNIL